MFPLHLVKSSRRYSLLFLYIKRLKKSHLIRGSDIFWVFEYKFALHDKFYGNFYPRFRGASKYIFQEIQPQKKELIMNAYFSITA